jgi:hypothetical protein
MAKGRQLHHFEYVLHSLLDIDPAHAANLKWKGKVLVHRHVREERVVLENHADTPLVRRHPIDRTTVQKYFAVGGGLKTREH